MLDIIKKYDLKNGIDYEYGYIIEIWSAEPDRTFYIVNENNKYENTDNIKFKKFIIIDDKLLSYDFYEQKYHKLLFEWEKNFNLWKDELNRQLKYVIPQKNIEDKKTWKNEKYLQLIDKLHSLNQNIQIIKNSENISKLKDKVKKLENKINDKFELIFNQLSVLQNKIEEIKNSSNDLLSGCSNFFGIISPISSLIPGAGTISSAITGVISGVCTLINS